MNSRRFFVMSVTVLAVYANSLWGAFQFDDYNVIVDNPAVHSFAAWSREAFNGIRPVLKLSYVLNRTISSGPAGFHIFNLAVHLCNVFLVYLIFSSLSCNDREEFFSTPFIAALLFGLHPVQTEAVTYICGRSVSMSALFCLVSLLLYLEAAFGRGIVKWKALQLHAASLLFYLLAVMTKETAIILPAVLVLLEISRREDTCRTVLKRLTLYWLVSVAMLLFMIAHAGHGRLLEYSFDIRGIGDNLLTQINGTAYLLSRLFVLNGMNIDPDLPVVREFSAALGAKALLLSALFIYGLMIFRRRPLTGFGIIWFFLWLLPTNSVIPRLDVANDRQLYISSAGLFLALSNELRPLLAHRDVDGKNRKRLLVAVMVLLGLFTGVRNNDYRSEIALWEDAVKKSPLKARPHNNLGYAYFLEGRQKEAEKEYLEALRLDPDYKKARNNLEGLRL